MTPNVYAIVPAAGRSRRMGTQKLLLPFAGSTVIGHVVRTLLSAPVKGVVVVTSPDGEAVGVAAKTAGAIVVVNDDPAAEMLTSVRCGIRALPADRDAALVALGDQPTVRGQLVADMIAADASIVVPTCNGRRGHPLLIGSQWFDDILTRYDGVGLRGLLVNRAEHVVELAVADERVLQDMDDPDAYGRALGLNPTP